MEIKLHKIKVKDLIKDYKNHPVDGVSGYGGKLDIRPKYQREFVYKEKQRNAVIETVKKGFPLNTMYWTVNTDENGEEFYEVLDGQQRTISICDFVGKKNENGFWKGEFSVKDEKGNDQFFGNIVNSNKELADKILNYELQVYFCKGTDTEKLDWFEIVNLAGETLSDQELRNAVYTGEWLSDAKAFFSKRNGAGENLGKKYLKGDFIRQAYLETALSWINNDEIREYMASHQGDKNADGLKTHFKKVISWVENTFPEYRKEMKGVNWGELYSQYGKANLDPIKLEKEVSALMQDEDVSNRRGIYTYVLNGEEKFLNIRGFKENTKREAYERQKGICSKCKKKFKLEEMEADHITPWSKGGKTSADNCQMLCKDDNRKKSNV